MSKVAVVGNYNIDLILGKVAQLPAWGTEMMIDTAFARVAGGAGNTAQALGALGVSALTVGVVGDDDYGNLIISTLKQLNQDTSTLIQRPETSTGVGFTILKNDGERSFLTYLGVLHEYQDEDLFAALDKVKTADIVLFTGYNLLPGLTTSGLEAFFSEVKKAGATLLFDTGWDVNNWEGSAIKRVKALLPYVDYFLPNLSEAQAITGQKGDLSRIGQQLLSFGARAVIIKQGPEGATYFSGSTVVQSKGVKVQAQDTTGAGDSFNAGVIYGLFESWSPKAYLDFANKLAAHVVQRLQDRFPTKTDLLDTKKEWIK